MWVAALDAWRKACAVAVIALKDGGQQECLDIVST
jgi:hypothetical protein